jgi:outer membrane protein assembly factor BamE (lipoprotein component of BamABCDE complex)
MRSGCRSVSLLLCSSLLLASTGCQSGQEVAQESTAPLYPGMTMDEVSDLLGPPVQVIQGDSETHWIYRFQGGPNAVGTVFLVIFFVAMIAALALAKGGGSISCGGGGGDGPPSQIRIRFGSDGRLIDVSPPQPVPGP